MRMARRGRKRQLGIEDEYWRLILSGVGTVEACRQVGITRKTGYGGAPNVVACHHCGSPKQPVLVAICRCWSGNGSPARHPTSAQGSPGVRTTREARHASVLPARRN